MRRIRNDNNRGEQIGAPLVPGRPESRCRSNGSASKLFDTPVIGKEACHDLPWPLSPARDWIVHPAPEFLLDFPYLGPLRSRRFVGRPEKLPPMVALSLILDWLTIAQAPEAR